MFHFTLHADKESTLRSTLLVLGIWMVYAVVSIYLENAVSHPDPLMKTALAFVCFLAFVSPLIYLWIKDKIRESVIAPILVLCLAVFYTSALTTISVPVGRNLPDVDFHAAKVLYASTGHLFNDPVTSFPSIYPPVYHIIVGSVMRIVGSNDSWYVLSRFHILMLVVLFLSVYSLANSLFHPRIGFLSVLFLGAIFDMPNQSGIFLPTPFLLALTVMVNSVALVYRGLKGKRWCYYPAGLLTGLAVTIWPAFLPVILVLLAVIFFTPEKQFRRLVDLWKFILTSLIFPLLVWIPQYLLLSQHHLLGHQSIGQFKGVPGAGWFLDFAVRFVFLGGFDQYQHGVTVLFGIIYTIFIGTAILEFRSIGQKDILKKRFLKLFIVLMLLSLPLVHYVFSYAYSRRLQVLFSLLMVILSASYWIRQLKKSHQLLAIAFITCAAVFANGWNNYTLHYSVAGVSNKYDYWEKYSKSAEQFIESHTAFGEYIFAEEETYRFVIMGNIIRFNLVAHRQGAYYSLNPSLSGKLLSDYIFVLYSDNFDLIKIVLQYYRIKYVLIYEGEPDQYPGLTQILMYCTTVFRNEYYTILRCDAP